MPVITLGSGASGILSISLQLASTAGCFEQENGFRLQDILESTLLSLSVMLLTSGDYLEQLRKYLMVKQTNSLDPVLASGSIS